MRRHLSLFACALLLIAFIGGCGFQPVHSRHGPTAGPDGAVAGAIQNVRVLQLKDRIGQQLHNRLVDRMYLDGYPKNPTHTLEVTLSSDQRGLGIQKDAIATRAELNMSATLILRTSDTRREVYRTTSRARVSYNILDAQYATLIARENANERGLDQIADDIVTRLSLFFSRNASAN